MDTVKTDAEKLQQKLDIAIKSLEAATAQGDLQTKEALTKIQAMDKEESTEYKFDDPPRTEEEKINPSIKHQRDIERLDGLR